jgi:hypothetical protein
MFDQALRYWFFLAIAGLVLVYYAADVQLIKVGAPAAVAVDYAISGRNAQGGYPAYPGNAPASNYVA